MASKSQDARPKITLARSECKEHNYITKKNRRNTPDRLELAKYHRAPQVDLYPRDPLTVSRTPRNEKFLGFSCIFATRSHCVVCHSCKLDE